MHSYVREQSCPVLKQNWLRRKLKLRAPNRRQKWPGRSLRSLLEATLVKLLLRRRSYFSFLPARQLLH